MSNSCIDSAVHDMDALIDRVVFGLRLGRLLLCGGSDPHPPAITIRTMNAANALSTHGRGLESEWLLARMTPHYKTHSDRWDQCDRGAGHHPRRSTTHSDRQNQESGPGDSSSGAVVARGTASILAAAATLSDSAR